MFYVGRLILLITGKWTLVHRTPEAARKLQVSRAMG
jgi:hypothetical protein